VAIFPEDVRDLMETVPGLGNKTRKPSRQVGTARCAVRARVQRAQAAGATPTIPRPNGAVTVPRTVPAAFSFRDERYIIPENALIFVVALRRFLPRLWFDAASGGC